MNEKVTAKKDMGFLAPLAATIAVIAIANLLTGCATSKSRAIDASGMYMSETGQLAVGRVHVDAIPEGQESAVVHYTEDTALLSPSTKTHDIDVILTGSNSVLHASEIVASICDAFVAVAPGIAKTNAAKANAADCADCADGDETCTDCEDRD